jgi:hypothetical protein
LLSITHGKYITLFEAGAIKFNNNPTAGELKIYFDIPFDDSLELIILSFE